MGYLVAVYGVVWAGTFLYLLHLARREQALAREIHELRARLVEGETSGMGG